MTQKKTGYVVALVAAVLVLVSSLGVTAAYAFLGKPAHSRSGAAGAGSGPMGTGMMGRRSAAFCAAPALPGTKVDVVVADMGAMMGGGRMMLRATPTTVRAGEVSLVVHNQGSATHELVVLPLAGTAQAGTRVAGTDGKIDESGSLGEVSATCAAGTGDGIAPGATGWLTLTVAAGRYEIVCNEPDHYGAGMFQELDVVS